MRAKSAKITIAVEQAKEYIAVPCVHRARRTGGEAESMCNKRVFVHIGIETKIKYTSYEQEEEKSKQAQKICMSRHAVISSLAMQQKQRMLARIKYYNAWGWIRARLISNTEDGRVAMLMYCEGA